MGPSAGTTAPAFPPLSFPEVSQRAKSATTLVVLQNRAATSYIQNSAIPILLGRIKRQPQDVSRLQQTSCITVMKASTRIEEQLRKLRILNMFDGGLSAGRFMADLRFDSPNRPTDIVGMGRVCHR